MHLVDVYRHLAGLPADVLSGKLEGRGAPPWTAAQVAARAGLGLDEVCLFALLRQGWANNPDLPAVDFVVDGTSHRFGAGEPELTLRAAGYEFVRMIISRRSRTQMLAADWAGADPTRIFPALCIFDLPENDLAD